MLTRAQFLALYAIATFAAWAIGPDGPLYWDSHGYVIQAITGRAGGLMLGRPAFVLVSHAVARAWLAAGGSLRAVEPLLRAWWMLVSAMGAPALAALALRVEGSARVAWTAGLLLALSPVVAHTSQAVLTDGPSMALALVALALGANASRRGSAARMGWAGVVLGVAGGMREPTLAHGATLLALAAVSRGPRWRLGAMAVAGAGLSFAAPVWWFVTTQRGYVEAVMAWSREMARERTGHPYGWRDFGMFVVWSLAAGPALWVGIARYGRAMVRGLRASPRALVVVGVSVVQYAALAFYQDISFSPRYLLAALPCAVVLPAAWGLGAGTRAWRVAVGASVVIAVAAAPVLRWRERPLRGALRELPARLAGADARAVVVTGQICPAVVYERELRRLEGSRGDQVQVCPGWRWPANLEQRLGMLRREGRPVVIDLREAVWVGTRQRVAYVEASSYARQHAGEAGVTVWR
jgi:4-amino-4-deoxy-L-arabinose transferase-like glycosyltransferase